jgi:VWFA-related protein
MRSWPRAILTILCGALAAWPQTPTLRITVTLVQIDTVVTDSHGHHVMDLSPEDFEILQDGQPQPVTFFQRVAGPPPADAQPIPGDHVPAPLTSTALTSTAQVRRAIALVVDDLALSWQDLVQTRDAIKRYIEQQMQPGDLVSIVRTGGGIAILEQFTTDKRLLLESASALKWRFNGRQGLGPIRPREDEAAAQRDFGKPEYLDYGYTLSALGALGTLEQVIQGMKSFPGRKSVVFFSDNLRVNQEIRSALDRITDLANRSMVSLYAIDPGGLRTKSGKQDPAIGDPDAETQGRSPEFPGADTGDELARQAGLDELAGRTGGLFYRNRNDIESCVREAADDQLGYYLLGYSPREGTFDAGGRGKFHKLTVRLLRPGLKARWKSGFNGVPDQLQITNSENPAKSREQQLLEALASPFKAVGIQLRLTSMYLEHRKYGPLVSSMLHFDGKDVTFTPEDGGFQARLDVVWTAYSGINKPMWQGEKPLDLHFSEQDYRTALRDGMMVPLNLPVRQPGTFLLRTVVRDAASQKIGSASQYVAVPDTRKGRLGMTGIVLRQVTKEIAQLVGNEPLITDDGWTQGGPAIRRFRPGQGIAYGCAVINPTRKGSNKKTAMMAFVRVFRNGKLVYTGPESRNLWEIPDRPNQVQGGGVLRLGPRLAAGEYLFQVIVRDENGKKKAPPLTQWIDFEVTDS